MSVGQCEVWKLPLTSGRSWPGPTAYGPRVSGDSFDRQVYGAEIDVAYSCLRPLGDSHRSRYLCPQQTFAAFTPLALRRIKRWQAASLAVGADVFLIRGTEVRLNLLFAAWCKHSSAKVSCLLGQSGVGESAECRSIRRRRTQSVRGLPAPVTRTEFHLRPGGVRRSASPPARCCADSCVPSRERSRRSTLAEDAQVGQISFYDFAAKRGGFQPTDFSRRW